MFGFMKKHIAKATVAQIIENIFAEAGFGRSEPLRTLSATISDHGYKYGELILLDKTISPPKDIVAAGYCIAGSYINKDHLNLRDDQITATMAALFKISRLLNEGAAHDEIILNDTDKVLMKTIDKAFDIANKDFSEMKTS